MLSERTSRRAPPLWRRSPSTRKGTRWRSGSVPTAQNRGSKRPDTTPLGRCWQTSRPRPRWWRAARWPSRSRPLTPSSRWPRRRRSFGDGSTASGAGVTHAYAAAGTYEVRVTASDAVGNSTSAARTIRVEPAPNVETALRIEGLSITPRRFAPVGGAVASRARKGGGTTIHYRLSEAARVSFAVERAAAGRRVGRNCVRPALHPLRAPAGRLRPGASRAPTACASTVACGGVRSPPAATGSSPSPPPATAGRRWCAPALGSWAPLSVVVDLARWRRTRWLIPN